MDVVFSVRAKLRRGVARLHETVLQVIVTKYFDLIFSSPSSFPRLRLSCFILLPSRRRARKSIIHFSRRGVGSELTPGRNPRFNLSAYFKADHWSLNLGWSESLAATKSTTPKAVRHAQIAPESFMMSASSGVGRMRSRCQARDWKCVRAWTAFMSGQGRMPL